MFNILENKEEIGIIIYFTRKKEMESLYMYTEDIGGGLYI